LNTSSASFSAVLASAATTAPAATKSASWMLDPAPAPASTVTANPDAISFLTLSGVAATRVSPGLRSFKTAIFAVRFPSPVIVLAAVSAATPRRSDGLTATAYRQATSAG
jgi:hypothetical protein